MEFDKLLDNCQTLEKTISILVKSNFSKQAELARLQSDIFEKSRSSLAELLECERQYQDKLDTFKCRKNDIETEIRQYAEINEKLSKVVAIAQNSRSDGLNENDFQCEDINITISETLRDYENIKIEHKKLVERIEHIGNDLNEETEIIQNLIKKNRDLVIDISRNDSLIRVSEQQSKYAEQQFDLILNQLPWEPLTEQYLDELKKSPDQTIRDLGETLQLQKNEIDDMNESLRVKERNKLQVLEQLYRELNIFAQKREEAVLVSRFIHGS